MLSHMHILLASSPRELLNVASNVDALSRRCLAMRLDATWREDLDAQGDDVARLLVGRRLADGPGEAAERQQTQQIAASFAYHCPLPDAIGARAGDLAHKAAALMHSWKFEVAGPAALARDPECHGIRDVRSGNRVWTS